MLGRTWRSLSLLLALAPAVALAQAAPAPPTAVVDAVLFFSPACPHCHKVMTQDLPPILQRYGGRLRIATVDVTTPGGQTLYRATVSHFALPDERQGVPTLVVGNRVLVGDEEIPQELPGIVDRGLAAGGIGWPAVPEIQAAAARAGAAEAQGRAAVPDTARTATPPVAPPPAARPRAGIPPAGAPGPDTAAAAPLSTGPIALTESSPLPRARERFLSDPVGNGAAVLVLVVMVLALGAVTLDLLGRRGRLPAAPSWLVPVLGVVGLGVASYLAVVEVTGARAVCGPVGDCNAVQQSAYAWLFGVLPIGVLGMAGYVGIVGAWVLGRLARGRLARLGTQSAWGMAFAGTAFSAYLTFLEPFVIGATCGWCLTSAVVVTLLLLALTPAVRVDGQGGA